MLALIAQQPHLSADAVRTQCRAEFGDTITTLSKGVETTVAMPPVRTFQHALKLLKERHKVELTKLTNPDLYRSTMAPSGIGMLRHITEPNQLWQIDASPVDALCVDGRHAVYACIDIATRRTIFSLSRTPRASAVALLIRKAILAWGVPDTIKTDMRATLQDLRMELGLRDGQIFDADLQDRLGYHLLKRRGYDEFMAGKISRTEFGKRLAQEWASLPVLATCQGAHVKLTRGQSYYCGDALNKSLVAPERVEAVLDKVKAAEGIATIDTLGGKSPEKPKPGPLAKSKRFWTWVMTGIGAPLAAFGALDWRVQFFIVAVIVGFAIYAISAMPQVRKALGLS